MKHRAQFAMRRRVITPEIGRKMARARWDAVHAAKPEHEPRRRKAYPLEIGFRDARSGEAAWVTLKSARQAKRLAARMLREWTPTPGGIHHGGTESTEGNRG